MKKLFLILMMAFVLAFTSAPTAKAIENPFPEGTFLLSAHLGFVPGVGVNVIGDYVLINEWWKGHFTVGGYVGVNTRSYNYFTGYDQYYSNFSVLPRATYGLNITNDFEVHAGVVSGLTLRTWTYEDDFYDADSDIKFTFGTLVGCKYYLSDSFGLSAEMCYAGWGTSYMNAGITFKF